MRINLSSIDPLAAAELWRRKSRFGVQISKLDFIDDVRRYRMFVESKDDRGKISLVKYWKVILQPRLRKQRGRHAVFR